MHPNKTMNRVINGKRYNVATATLLASDEYWDGHNFERNGRNTFLYRTRGGAYFEVNLTQWDGEKDTLLALSEQDAKDLYESLQEHPVDYDAAFGEIAEESTAGRPPIYDKPMIRAQIRLEEDDIDWLKANGGITETLRELVKRERETKK